MSKGDQETNGTDFKGKRRGKGDTHGMKANGRPTAGRKAADQAKGAGEMGQAVGEQE